MEILFENVDEPDPGVTTDVAPTDPASIAAGAPQPVVITGVEPFLHALARALHQFRVYPAGSPFVEEAVAALHRSLSLVDAAGLFEARVTERDVMVGDVSIGQGTAIERELVRLLRRASISGFRIDLDATRQDLTQFCLALLQTQDSGATAVERLAQRGVERIALEIARAPEIVELVNASVADSHVIQRERRDVLFVKGEPAHHLLPPDRCWIRVDPSTPVATLSLKELAILVGDPVRLAGILVRVSGEETDPFDPGAPLEHRFQDLSAIFASLEPHVGRELFARLAQAVLQLEHDARVRLLKRTILPGLLEGRSDAAILQDFPDLELVDALCLLLELENAAPQVLGVALSKLDLPDDRREAMLPLLHDRLRAHQGVGNDARGIDGGLLDSYARRLIHVGGNGSQSFEEFAAFDVALDEAAVAGVAQVRADVDATDWLHKQLQSLCCLVRLEPNSERVDGFLDVVLRLADQLERRDARLAVTAALRALAATSSELGERRPQIAASIASAFERFCTPDRVAWLVTMYRDQPERHSIVREYIEALGPAIAPALTALLDAPPHVSASAHELLGEFASTLAPGLALQLKHRRGGATRGILRALGRAGAGYESLVARHLDDPDPVIQRDALHALVRMATPHAARHVAACLRSLDQALRESAVEALPRFPPAVAAAELRTLLRDEGFVAHQADVVLQLLNRLPAAAATSLGPELRALAALRRRFWRPALVRVASRAGSLVES